MNFVAALAAREDCMQVSVESGEGLERRMRVELPAEQVDQEVEKRLERIARTARMNGFRPGKIPLSVVRRRFGGQVRQEVYGELIQSSFSDALKQQNLHPAGEPQIEPVQDSDSAAFAYTAVFEVFPEFQLAELDKLSVRRPVVEIEDADVDRMIEKLRRQRVEWREVERGAADGDLVKVSFVGKVDGEPFEGGEGKDVALVLGSKRMIPGFEDALIGAASGDQRNLDLQFPDDYRVETLAGKPVTFEVQVISVSEPELPEVDEQFARLFGVDEGGVEAFRRDVRSSMQRELDQKIRARVKSQVMDGLLEAHQFEVPKSLIDREVERLRQEARSQVSASGKPSGLELPRELFEVQARRRVTLGLIIGNVIQTKGMKVDPERVRRVIEEHASSYEQPQELIDWYYNNREHLSSVESVVMEDQVVDWVAAKAQVEDEKMSFESIMETAN
jgi:trigger factor